MLLLLRGGIKWFSSSNLYENDGDMKVLLLACCFRCDKLAWWRCSISKVDDFIIINEGKYSSVIKCTLYYL